MTDRDGTGSIRDRLSGIVQAAVERGASDVHLGAGDPPMIRVGRELLPLEDQATMSGDDLVEMIDSVLSERARERLAEGLAVTVAYEVPGVARLRANIYRAGGSVAAAFRVLPVEIQSIEDLGLPTEIEELIRPGEGLVLVAGRSGSGRSTTLAAMLDFINSERSCHVVTIEEPIEFVHRRKRALVHQRAVGNDVAGFVEALRDALSQDTDVILIGAMDEVEVIDLAILAAETGHLVLAPSDAQTAPDAIERIIDAFPEARQEHARHRVGTVIRGVVRQQLLPAAGGLGRVAACEGLIADDAVRNLVRQGKVDQLYSMMTSGGGRGMQTMEQALTELVTRGVVSSDAALAATSRREQLLGLFERRGVRTDG